MNYPKIIYGTAWKKDMTSSLVVMAVLQGFRAIDTGMLEDLVGEALQILKTEHGVVRESLFLQTKYTPIDSQDRLRPIPYSVDAPITGQIQQSFEKSLANLRTTYLDSYILHSPFRRMDDTLEAWRVLVSLQDQGKVHAIGISNCYDVRILRALETVRRVQVVQNRWFEGNGWDQEVYQYCMKYNVPYQSFWTLTGSPSLLAHPSVVTLANSLGCSREQAVYRYAQSIGITPLCGTQNEEHMHQDVRIADIPIDDNARTHIESITKFIRG
ncbi:Aldo/keto reductase [Fistulina hepatica ATCC 64428]|uniref:Aldo/keto reductase n=1 Tax=Fistulina hepatica ATCC 64428 TaxID=1128425 RepID=A0A0D7AR67_9AGAR|nr:Aldo/keto reductase [Fistulina hepatica ATCC 64428]